MDAAKLRSFALFDGLDADHLARFARWADEVDVAEGKHLVDEGRFAYEFFVILEGTAAALHGQQELRTLGPGDFFGEMGLLEGKPRSASVVARTPMRLAVLFAREFQQMAREMPEIAERIRGGIEDRSRELAERAD